MSEWIEWCIALIQVCVDWLGSIRLLGVSVMWIILACLFIGLIVRSVIYRV